MTHRKLRLLVLCAAVGTALLTTSSAFAWTVTQTAQPKLKRTFAWKIEKSVSQSAVMLKAGETADVTYTVTATPTGSVDSDWGVSGLMTMTKDPKIGVASLWFKIIPETTQSPEILADYSCLPATFPVELGLDGLECAYGAALPDAAPRRTFMRAVSTDPPPDGPNFRAVLTPFDFSNPTVELVDESVVVTDSMGGTLGTVNAADGPKTFTYTKTIGPYTAAQCGSKTVDNTASYVTNDSGSTGSASASVNVTVACPPPGGCHETVNPAGNPGVGDNGHPDDPFGGDAVPGGRHTTPGNKGNGPINSDGFYLVGGLLFSDTTPIAYPGGGFVWPVNTTVKYTERGNPNIKISSMAGPHSVIEFQIQAPGDLYANAPKGSAGAIFCGVPPPPF